MFRKYQWIIYFLLFIFILVSLEWFLNQTSTFFSKMHILKSFKYVYDPFQVSLWALLIIIMPFHLLFVVLIVLFLFMVLFILDYNSQGHSRTDPRKVLISPKAIDFSSKWLHFEFLIGKLTIHKKSFIYKYSITLFLNKILARECIDLEVLSVRICRNFFVSNHH